MGLTSHNQALFHSALIPPVGVASGLVNVLDYPIVQPMVKGPRHLNEVFFGNHFPILDAPVVGVDDTLGDHVLPTCLVDDSIKISVNSAFEI